MDDIPSSVSHSSFSSSLLDQSLLDHHHLSDHHQQENPDIQEAQAEGRERLIDTAQSKLGDAVRNGDAWAVKFVLETWGKSRGFTKMVQVESKDEPLGVMHLYFPDDGRSGPDPLNIPAPSIVDGEATTLQNSAGL